MIKRLSAAALACLLAGCAAVPDRGGKPPPSRTKRAVELVPPDRWPDMSDGLPVESLAAAAESSIAFLEASEQKLYRFGDRRIGTGLLLETARELLRIRRESKNPGELASRLKAGFDLYRVGSPKTGEAHFSSYYQPVLRASRKRSGEFRYPLYRKPPDMIEADLGAFDPKLKGRTAIGRMDGRRFVPYFDRRDIDVRKTLEGKGLEIAYLSSGFDRLNIHIQGSGILRFRDGTEALARYAATNGLPYKSVGMSVVGAGVMTREEITAEKLKKYLAEHPEGEAWLISRNPRYTFFELVPLPDGKEPFGSAGQPLVAGRSIAVDPKATPLGATAYLTFPMIQADEAGRFLGKRPARRFVMCHDTGGAIKGPGRVDLYVGHGSEAESTARNVWERGRLYVLLKKLPGRRR